MYGIYFGGSKPVTEQDLCALADTAGHDRKEHAARHVQARICGPRHAPPVPARVDALKQLAWHGVNRQGDVRWVPERVPFNVVRSLVWSCDCQVRVRREWDERASCEVAPGNDAMLPHARRVRDAQEQPVAHEMLLFQRARADKVRVKSARDMPVSQGLERVRVTACPRRRPSYTACAVIAGHRHDPVGRKHAHMVVTATVVNFFLAALTHNHGAPLHVRQAPFAAAPCSAMIVSVRYLKLGPWHVRHLPTPPWTPD